MDEYILKRAEALVKGHEGLELKPYNDSLGVLTIGYGRNLRDRGVSQEEAEYLLRNDLSMALADAKWAVGLATWENLTTMRKSVLVDMAYNLGLPKLQQFIKFIEALRDGDYEKAVEEMLDSRWARQVKTRATHLAQLMKEG